MEAAVSKSRYHLGICLAGLGKATETLSHDRWCPSRDSYSATPEFKCRGLPIDPHVRFYAVGKLISLPSLRTLNSMNLSWASSAQFVSWHDSATHFNIILTSVPRPPVRSCSLMLYDSIVWHSFSLHVRTCYTRFHPMFEPATYPSHLFCRALIDLTVVRDTVSSW
jgi:hypothetical protein